MDRKTKLPAGRDCCRRVTFSLFNALGETAGFEDLARLIGVDPADEAAVLAAVRRRVVGLRSLRRLPALTPVVNDDSGSTMSGFTDDLDMTLAVLVRCSDRAFIRRHHPIVTRDRLERVVTLILSN